MVGWTDRETGVAPETVTGAVQRGAPTLQGTRVSVSVPLHREQRERWKGRIEAEEERTHLLLPPVMTALETFGPPSALMSIGTIPPVWTEKTGWLRALNDDWTGSNGA